jgi:hypothetical protein
VSARLVRLLDGHRAISAILILVGAAAVSYLLSLGSLESGARWDITLRNDTSSAVVVRACTGWPCSGLRYTKQVGPERDVAA